MLHGMDILIRMHWSLHYSAQEDSPMLSLLIVAARPSLASNPAPRGLDAGPATTDEAALAQVGRDADAHVRLALWCEAHGLSAERLKHLAWPC